jgi:hypothetical protein
MSESEPVRIEGNKVTVELPPGTRLPIGVVALISAILNRVAKEAGPGASDEEIRRLALEALEGSGTAVETQPDVDAEPVPTTERGKRLYDALMKARAAYAASGRKFLSREELDDLHDRLRGRR